MKYLLDSNALIYAARPEARYAPFRSWARHPDAAVSAMSRVEVLGFARLTAADARFFAALFQLLPQLPITDAVLNQAVHIRQQVRIKTPDALIAATALVHDLELVTVDSDFAQVAGLAVVNPLFGA
jgi:predicted nucleic acid-binding protein